MPPAVVTFTPPPVPPGAAPMNINSTIRNRLGTLIFPMSTELKPVVEMVVTD